ncbi:MAG: protein kinase, partial [Planctomycetes bacterium]|nr:protein kinase [Planctomycetota bacterium]
MAKEPTFFMDGLSRVEGSAETPAPLPPDTDSFEFVRELGRGGMGVVYEAIERESGRRVALKVVLPSITTPSSVSLERFEREARAAARIAHPNCVFVYGFHIVEGQPAIAMEFVSGETIHERIERQGTPEVATGVHWVLELLDGIEAAHAAGVIHRDIKPANVFLTHDGRVKLGDFGLSHEVDSELSLTRSGAFLGSPLFASPEQVRGRKIDERSDLYSAGATLYTVLTGGSPFRSSSLGDLFTQIATEPPIPPRRLRPRLPRGLERVVLRALEKEPSRRFQSCEAFRDALQPFAPGAPSPAGFGLRIAAWLIDVLVISFGMALIVFVVIRLVPGFLPDLPDWVRNHLTDLIAVAYWGLLEGRFGSTPAKALLGLRVVHGNGRAGVGRATLRALIVNSAFMIPAGNWLLRGLALAIPVLIVSTMRRRNGFRGLHEFASGTRVLQRQAPIARLRLARQVLETLPEPTPAVDARLPEGLSLQGRLFAGKGPELLIAHDDRLDREVWVLISKSAAERPSDAQRGATGPTDLRWLEGRAASDGSFVDVFESPGGAALGAYRDQKGRVDWPTARTALITLTTALQDPTMKPRFEQLWIDRDGRLRRLPFRIDGLRGPPNDEPDLRIETVVACLFGLDERDPRRLPADLPENAETLIRRLVAPGASTPDPIWLKRELEQLDSHP